MVHLLSVEFLVNFRWDSRKVSFFRDRSLFIARGRGRGRGDFGCVTILIAFPNPNNIGKQDGTEKLAINVSLQDGIEKLAISVGLQDGRKIGNKYVGLQDGIKNWQ